MPVPGARLRVQRGCDRGGGEDAFRSVILTTDSRLLLFGVDRMASGRFFFFCG